MTAAESSHVQWGRTPIPYAIRRSERRRTVSIAVEPTGDVVLTAPRTTPVVRLDRLVRQKARWIVDRLRVRSEGPPTTAREFVSGESFLYVGRSYRLKVVLGASPSAPVALDHGWLRVHVPKSRSPSPSPSDVRRATAARVALVDWYKARAAARLPARVAEWSRRLGVREPKVLIREPKKRWGSCDAAGTLRLNWRIVQAPMRLVDYVVAHELVHIDHPDHNEGFWRVLRRVMPDYEERREALRRMGTRLVW